MNSTAPDLRARVDAALQEHRARRVPGWLTRRRNRRALAVLPLAVLVLGVTAGVVPDGVPRAVLELSTVLAGLGTTPLRRVTRLLDAMPDRLLDEREIAERNDAARRAYQLATGVVAALFLTAAVSDLLQHLAGSPLITAGGWVPVMVGALLTVTMIPSAVGAWRWEDDSPETS
jgi:hypothetical protein